MAKSEYIVAILLICILVVGGCIQKTTESLGSFPKRAEITENNYFLFKNYDVKILGADIGGWNVIYSTTGVSEAEKDQILLKYGFLVTTQCSYDFKTGTRICTPESPSTVVMSVSTTVTTTSPHIRESQSVAAFARQRGNDIVVTWQGGKDNAIVSSYNVFIKDSGTPYAGYPPIIGNTTTYGGGSNGNDHVVVVAIFTDGTARVILDSYV